MRIVAQPLRATDVFRRLIRPVRLRKDCHLDRAVSWSELFFDLIFVAAVAQLASPLVQDYSVAGLLRFGFFFVVVWMGWLDHTFFHSRFHSDDSLHRILTVAQIFIVAVMAANARAVLSSREAAGFGAAYGAMRLVLMLQHVRTSKLHPSGRMIFSQAVAMGISALLWLIAAVSPTPLRYGVWAIAFSLDIIGPWLRRHHFSLLPPDSAHLPERIGLFTIILLGEFVAAVMRGMEAQDSWPPAAFVAALGGFCIAFACWWIYFQHCEAAEPHSIPQFGAALRYHLWAYLHVPIYIALTVIGVGIEHIIAGSHFGTSEAALLGVSAIVMAGALGLLARLTCAQTKKVTAPGSRDFLTSLLEVP